MASSSRPSNLTVFIAINGAPQAVVTWRYAQDDPEWVDGNSQIQADWNAVTLKEGVSPRVPLRACCVARSMDRPDDPARQTLFWLTMWTWDNQGESPTGPSTLYHPRLTLAPSHSVQTARRRE
jgi:hypothetical protein